MKNQLSVIIPVYNVESYLSRCVDSVLMQTFNHLEIILVNDGSTDSSGLICDEFASKDKRVKVIHQKNAGVSAARNAGMQSATGDYIAFVDSDDWLEQSMYESMMEIAVRENIDVIMCDFVNVKNQVKTEISSHLRKGHYVKNEIIEELYPTLIVTENFGRIPIVSVWNCLFRRKFLLDHQLSFDTVLKYSEDYLFMAQVITKADTFYYLKEKFFYNYLQYEESRSKKYQPEWWSNLLRLNIELSALLGNNREFDFGRQLKLQLIHSVLLVLNKIEQNNTMEIGEKIRNVKTVMNHAALKSAFQNLSFDHQKQSIKFVLYLIKYKMAGFYIMYRTLISKTKHG